MICIKTIWFTHGLEPDNLLDMEPGQQLLDPSLSGIPDSYGLSKRSKQSTSHSSHGCLRYPALRPAAAAGRAPGGETGPSEPGRIPERVVRGFAIKFHTPFIRTQKRHPRSNLRSPTAMWDFWVKRQGSERGTEQGESGGDGDHGAIMVGICQQSVTSAQQRLNVAHCGRAESVKRNGAGSTGR